MKKSQKLHKSQKSQLKSQKLRPQQQSHPQPQLQSKPKIGVGFGIMLVHPKNGKILLGQRHHDPVKADSAMHGEGTWTMPGGKLDFGESFEGGAVREMKEETGIVIKAKDLRMISVANNITKNKDAHFVTIGMYCDHFSGEAQVMEPDEITRWQWFSLDALPTPLFPPSAEIIDRHKKGIVYES